MGYAPKWSEHPRIGALVCRAMGHAYVEFEDGFKRRCPRCNREEWVMSRPYPKVGEAKYFWEHMDF